MEFKLKQKIDLSEYYHDDYNKETMPVIIGEITKLAEKFLGQVLEQNFECNLLPMDDDAKLHLVVSLSSTDENDIHWEMSVDKILEECLDQACIAGKDKTFLKKMRDALSKQVEKVDLWMELMDKND